MKILGKLNFFSYIRESAAWQNGELEKQVVCIQEELRKADYPWDSDIDLQKESLRHKQLLEAIDTLKEQLPILKEKIKGAKVCGPGKYLKAYSFYPKL